MVHSPQAAHTHREAETAVVGWQPVETMPPGQRVLVWVNDNKCSTYGVRFGSCYRSAGRVVAKPEGCNGGPWGITHWMPLPDEPT